MNILIVAFHDPRSDAMGAQRTKSLAEYLWARGWGVSMLTSGAAGAGCQLIEPAQADDWHQIAGDSEPTPEDGPKTFKSRLRRHRRIRALLYRYREMLTSWPDPARERAWAARARNLVRTNLSGADYDVVISSAPPWVTHQVAADIAEEWRVPWVPDYRDLWSNSPYYPWPRWRRRIDRQIESRLLRRATAITTATPLCSKDLRDWRSPTPVRTILNGFCPRELDAITPSRLGPGRHVVYAGSWYSGRRDPRPVLDALKDPALSDVVMHFVGPADPELESEVAGGAVGHQVRFHGSLPRREALGIVAAADVALLLTWNDPREAAVIPGKFYEYMGLRRPILVLGYEGGTVAQLLREYGHGCFADSPQGVVEMIQDSHTVRGTGVAGSMFTRDRQSRKWAEFLSAQAAVNRGRKSAPRSSGNAEAR